jgi:hypothetical protein
MEFFASVGVALAAAVLLALSPREHWPKALRIAGVFAVVAIVLSVVLPPLTALLLGARDELRAYVPSARGALASVLGFLVRRGGVAVIMGLMLRALVQGSQPRFAVVAIGAVIPAALEVVLQTDAIRSLSTVFPPVVIANLLAPEVAPPFFAGLAAASYATRNAHD